MLQSQSKKTIAEMAKFFGAKTNHLPSTLTQVGSMSDWIAGPRINVIFS